MQIGINGYEEVKVKIKKPYLMSLIILTVKVMIYFAT